METNHDMLHPGNSICGHGQPVVGLVIPMYNAEEYIEECLESITRQTFRSFRVIIVDDGSTDNSARIVETFCRRDSRFRMVSGKRGGVSAARNLGIGLIDEKYIGFVDADDCLQPQMLEKLVDVLESGLAEVSICGFRRGVEFVEKTFPAVAVKIYDYTSAMRDALYQKVIMNSPCGMLMRRDLLGDDIRFREGIRYEDLDAFYRFYSRATHIAYLPQDLYFYRQQPGSFLHTWSRDRLDALDVTDRIVEYMKEHNPEVVDAALDRRFSAHFNMLLLMLSVRGEADREVIDRCLAVIREGRKRAIRDRSVRLKNKLGAIASYGGLPMLKLLSKI